MSWRSVEPLPINKKTAATVLIDWAGSLFHVRGHQLSCDRRCRNSLYALLSGTPLMLIASVEVVARRFLGSLLVPAPFLNPVSVFLQLPSIRNVASRYG